MSQNDALQVLFSVSLPREAYNTILHFEQHVQCLYTIAI